MRSSLRARVEVFRRLWGISPRVHASGLPRRLRLAGLTFRSDAVNLTGDQLRHLVLLDSNENKVQHAEREFGERCTRLDPLRPPAGRGARFCLLLSLLLPARLGDVTVCMILARSFHLSLPHGARLAFYNPYFLLQYAIAELCEVDKVFHLVPEYPRVESAKEALACLAAHEILGYHADVQRVTIQPHTIVDDHLVVRVYLSQLVELEKLAEERALIDFVRWIRDRVEVPVEIFLHYIDRGVAESDPRASALIEEFGDLICREASLHQLSSGQVSFSGSSSIGYDLLSSSVCHVMVYDQERQATRRVDEDGIRIVAWRTERTDVIPCDSPPEHWLEALRLVDEVRYHAVFGAKPTGT